MVEYSPSPRFIQRKAKRKSRARSVYLPFTLFSVCAPAYQGGGGGLKNKARLMRKTSKWSDSGMAQQQGAKRRNFGFGAKLQQAIQVCTDT